MACRAVAEGELVTISYLDTSEPTHVRQRILRRTKHFVCRCELCRDPDEGGRCGALLRCPAPGCPGWQRPAPPPPAPAEAWVCERCDARTSRAEVCSLALTLTLALTLALALALTLTLTLALALTLTLTHLEGRGVLPRG